MANEQMQNNAVPIFTPPAPTFTPPQNARPANGRTCHYHTNEPAVARCARCGKYICEDCFDNYGVSSGEFEGEALCYDCCRELVAQNVKDLTKNKRKIKFQFIVSIIGMVIGFIFGLSAGIESGSAGSGIVMTLIGIGIGGVFFSFLKFYLHCLWIGIKESFKSLFNGSGIWGIIGVFIGLAFRIIIEAFKSIYYTIRNTIYYIGYLKETSGFIESDTAALQQMADYMEYTMIRNQNRGVDLETLLNQQSELADNSYARMVLEQGEAQAEAHLRGCVASINENGEIIRDFAA